MNVSLEFSFPQKISSIECAGFGGDFFPAVRQGMVFVFVFFFVPGTARTGIGSVNNAGRVRLR